MPQHQKYSGVERLQWIGISRSILENRKGLLSALVGQTSLHYVLDIRLRYYGGRIRNDGKHFLKGNL